MGHCDLETDAALTELNFEELSKTPGGEFVSIISDLIALIGTGGLWAVTGGASNLLLKIRNLAGASYSSNLIYAVTAVRNDLKTLYETNAELRERLESLRNDPRFAEAIAALALRTMHTSVKDRLRRLARILVNGVWEDDLETESLDDMMRAAIELKESDIALLGAIYSKQFRLLQYGYLSHEWSEQIAASWSTHFEHLDSRQHIEIRGSLMRLQSLGLLATVEAMTRDGSIAHQPFGLLPEGKKFYERLREIGSEK